MTTSLSSGGKRFFYVALCVALFALTAIPNLACDGSSSSPDGDTEPDGDTRPDGDTEPDGDTVPDGDLPPDGDDEDGDTTPDGEEPDGDTEDGDTDRDADDEETPPPGSLRVTPDPIDFGVVDLLGEAVQTVQIENDAAPGDQAVTVRGVELTRSSAQALSVRNCQPPFVLQPGEEIPCDVVCNPEKPGAHDGVLRVHGTSAEGEPLERRVDILCDTVLPIAYADPLRVEFGYLAPDAPQRTRFVTIGNVGSADLEVYNVAIQGGEAAFTLLTPSDVWEDILIAPSGGFLVELRYLPTTGEQTLAWLVVETNDPQLPERRVLLSGRGLAGCPEGQTLEGDTCRAVCIPDTLRCTGNGLGFRTCSSAGDALSEVEACPTGRRCLDGACVWALCVEGEDFCRQGTPARCTGTLTSEASADACADDPDCPSVCAPGGFCAFPDANHYCDDDNPCTNNTCTHGQGCDFPFNNDPCENSDVCLVNTRCYQGACLGAPRDCDDNNPCTATSCDPETGCEGEPVDGSCNDMDACTQADRCEDGNCVGDPVVCDDDNACTTNSCDPVRGCLFVTSGQPCDDDNPCTRGDLCVSFGCRGETFNPSDGLFCNGPEVCDPSRPEGEAILSPSPVICNDGVACTVDLCNEDMKRCDYLPDASRCDDGNPCTVDTCDLVEGCVHTPRTNGSACDVIPGVQELCFNGQCASRCSEDADCQDGLGCTIDTCDLNVNPGFGWCHHEPIHTLCDDDLFCNGEEVCNLRLGCVAGTPVNCSDTHLCTWDTCDEENRRCVNQPRNWMCDDYNPCTLNLCQPSEGCVYLATQGGCDDENPCTLGDFCQDGQCQPGPTALVCDDGNPCTDNVCDHGYGCRHPFNQNICDDQDACTSGGVCESGTCVGTPLQCDDSVFCNGQEGCGPDGCFPGELVSCDDGVTCTVDSCHEETQGCLHTPDPSRCADQNPCTVNETCTETGCVAETLSDGTVCKTQSGEVWTCQEGFCVAPCTYDEDCQDNVACTLDSCNIEAGYCVHAPTHIWCSDGLWCTGEEVCDRLEGCLPGDPVTCDDGIACTVDTCDSTELTCTQSPDNALCDDGNICTLGVCNPETGCTQIPTNADCDDGNRCTLNDRCQNGVCVGLADSCDNGNPCTVGHCDPMQGCVQRTLQDGTSCGTLSEDRVCRDGACVEGCTRDSSCDDGVPCTLDTCNPHLHQCQHQPVNALCDDGAFCNGVEICDPLMGCLPGAPVTCDDDNPCTRNVCDDGLRRCRNPQDTTVCDDGNPCTDNICTPTGCNWVNNTRPCDDGNYCTTGDTCSQGHCQGQPRSCNDNNLCTQDSCDPFFGCLNVPVVCPDAPACKSASCDPARGCITLNTTDFCDDANPCTVGDRCHGGSCTPGSALTCDDHNTCTSDACGPDGCVHTPLADGSSCLLAYGESGRCLAGLCAATCTSNAHCRDSVACSTGTCNTTAIPGVGVCDFTLDHNACDDGVTCNGQERCAPFVGCVPGQPVACDDGLPCTLDSCDEDQEACVHEPVHARCASSTPCLTGSCDPALGCVYANNDGLSCDDGNPCTVETACLDGLCVGQPRDCDDDNPCTGPAACDPRKGCRVAPVEDGTPCGEDGVCTKGACSQSCRMDADCDDGVACTLDVCDPRTGRCLFMRDHAACNDGRWCNGQEWCHPTLDCQPGIRVACDDGIACTRDSCSDELQRCVHTPIHTLCEDGNLCTVNTCDTASGCVSTYSGPLPCDDGNACSMTDTCQEGICRPAEWLSCEGTDCMMTPCDARTGCLAIPRDGPSCARNTCSLFSRCVVGECVVTLPRNCADINPCTADSCDPVGGCQYQPRHGELCNDQNRCTVETQCNNTVCQGPPRDCDDHNPCTVNACNPSTGCSQTPANENEVCSDPLEQPGLCVSGHCATLCQDGEPCDDHNLCTLSGSCVDGLCIGTPLDCDDGNPCTENACDPATGCTSYVLPDQSVCTQAGGQKGVCIQGTCEVFCGQDADCDDGNPCTLNTCAPSGCVTTKRSDGTVCDDGDPCTLEDFCSEGRCKGAERVQCVSPDPCVSGSCGPDGQCVFETHPDGRPCDDHDACTLGDVCQSGVCAGTPLSCEDDNPCTVTFCDRGSCSLRKLTGDVCDDGNPCTLESRCMAGICRGVLTNPCDDGNPCTHDSCTGSGCLNTPITGRVCDDGDPCTVGDLCREGLCVPGAGELACTSENPCLVGECATNEGCQWEELEDNTPCGGTLTCQGGLCVD